MLEQTAVAEPSVEPTRSPDTNLKDNFKCSELQEKLISQANDCIDIENEASWFSKQVENSRKEVNVLFPSPSPSLYVYIHYLK